jgi:hypothetical protein
MLLLPALAVTTARLETPPSSVKQLPVTLLGVATTRPLGNGSVKARLDRVVVLFGLLMLKVSEVVPLTGMLAAPKAFARVGGATTVSVAEAVLPVPPFVDVTALVVFRNCPAVVAVTATLKVQLALAAMVAPDREIVLLPLVERGVPPQTVLVPLATVRPAGKTSVKPMPISATVLAAGLVMVKLKEVELFVTIIDGMNTLEITGGAVPLTTVMDAIAALPVIPMEEPAPSSKVAVMLLVVLILLPS